MEMPSTGRTRGFIDRYLALRRSSTIRSIRRRSPCEIGEPIARADGTRVVPWRPRRRPFADDFAGLEHALEIAIHPDIKAYYGAYWSGGLEATAADGHVSLLFLWNPEDADRLVENLIGHALAKRRARSPFTVFFACTEAESELFLTVDNASGAVLLERPGHRPIRQVSDSLAAFLDGLEPALRIPRARLIQRGLGPACLPSLRQGGRRIASASWRRSAGVSIPYFDERTVTLASR
jgi:SecY interacting protein Syd